MSVKERFLNYIRFDTQSDSLSKTSPSTSKQLIFAEYLKEECQGLGMNVELDEFGIVYATLCENDASLQSFGFCAHMDTATELSGKDVHARVIEKYDGSPIVLNEEYTMPIEDVQDFIGQDLIVTDGTTLLGADDKAGIAILMEAVSRLKDKKHGKIILMFTPDEEVGRGTEHVNLDKFQADYHFTVDGSRIDCIDTETFNAAQAVISIQGTSIHPGDAKDKMVNAANLAVAFANALPKDQVPEKTEGREGFFHLLEMEGQCEEAKLIYLVRNHSKDEFNQQKNFLMDLTKRFNEVYPGRFEITIEDQYCNMKEYINDPSLIQIAQDAIKANGLTPISLPVRGGTDGAMLSAKGCPCPNLGTGSYNHHGRFEFASIDEMEKMVDIVLTMIEGDAR